MGAIRELNNFGSSPLNSAGYKKTLVFAYVVQYLMDVYLLLAVRLDFLSLKI